MQIHSTAWGCLTAPTSIFIQRKLTLTTRRRRGQRIIGQLAIVEVPDRHGSNVTHAEMNNRVVTVSSPWGHITPNIFSYLWMVIWMCCLGMSSIIMSRQSFLCMMHFGAITVVVLHYLTTCKCLPSTILMFHWKVYNTLSYMRENLLPPWNWPVVTYKDVDSC